MTMRFVTNLLIVFSATEDDFLSQKLPENLCGLFYIFSSKSFNFKLFKDLNVVDTESALVMIGSQRRGGSWKSGVRRVFKIDSILFSFSLF